MIIDLHRHLWSIVERYSAAREIVARGGVVGIHDEVEQMLGGTAAALMGVS